MKFIIIKYNAKSRSQSFTSQAVSTVIQDTTFILPFFLNSFKRPEPINQDFWTARHSRYLSLRFLRLYHTKQTLCKESAKTNTGNIKYVRNYCFYCSLKNGKEYDLSYNSYDQTSWIE